jgi:hypothetical protein
VLLGRSHECEVLGRLLAADDLQDLTSCARTAARPAGPVLVVGSDVALRAAVDAPFGGGDLAREG